MARAATASGVGRKQAYRARETFPAFAEAWDEILDDWVDRVEATTFEMAIDGQREPIVNKEGEVVGERVTRYPRINEFLLSTRRREMYGKQEQREAATEIARAIHDALAAGRAADGLDGE